ncbi:hypothetical protein [Rhodoplanes roseus]|uniref:hypothetical protein n=1 Tax=Rhodoplanes roseus TaxID=29409 RepID=UPI0011B40629|nr:hypothetical protein [Rhodoplanes roseus]
MSIAPLDAFCSAVTVKQCLEVDYKGHSRVIEVHAVGYSQANNLVALVWQVHGGSSGSETAGWKLLRISEVTAVRPMNASVEVPRPGYRGGGTQIPKIICQL